MKIAIWFTWVLGASMFQGIFTAFDYQLGALPTLAIWATAVYGAKNACAKWEEKQQKKL